MAVNFGLSVWFRSPLCWASVIVRRTRRCQHRFRYQAHFFALLIPHSFRMPSMFSSRCLAVLVLFSSVRFVSAATPYWVRIIDAGTHSPRCASRPANPQGTTGRIAVESPLSRRCFARTGRAVQIHSDGYGFEQKILGEPGTTLHVQAGNHDELKIERFNFAERLYRVTGANIYRNPVLAGLKPPIRRVSSLAAIGSKPFEENRLKTTPHRQRCG